MSNVLPPQAGLTVGGIVYRYSVEKQREDELKVTIQNEDKILGGYVLSYTDDWTDKEGSRIVKQYQLPNISIDRIGNGSITQEGTGTVFDPNVGYTYTYDECYDPLSSPECPGYEDAYLAYLFANGLLDLNGPDYDPMQEQALLESLDTETELEEEQAAIDREEEEEEEEENLEKLLSIRDEADELANAFAQQQLLLALNNAILLKPYIETVIAGGIYEDAPELQDKKISDNRRAALRMGLAQDQVHEKIVASQYEGD